MPDYRELRGGSITNTADRVSVEFQLPGGAFVAFEDEIARAMLARARVDSPIGGEQAWESLRRQVAAALAQ
jgi:hypothetical protein